MLLPPAHFAMFVLGGGGTPLEAEESKAGMAKKVFSHMSMAVKA